MANVSEASCGAARPWLARWAGQANLSPYAGLQFFGEVNTDARSAALTVRLIDLQGNPVFTRTLAPHGR